MNKIVQSFLFFLLIMSLGSCEVDDICTETVLTPKLIIRFYDADDTALLKSVEGIYVWAENKDSLYVNTSVDSIALPLNTQATTTKYLLSTNSVVDTLYLHYTNQEIYVSRSCGYKYNFILQEETDLSNEWISSFETMETPQIIENEQAAHLKIYH